MCQLPLSRDDPDLAEMVHTDQIMKLLKWVISLVACIANCFCSASSCRGEWTWLSAEISLYRLKFVVQISIILHSSMLIHCDITHQGPSLNWIGNAHLGTARP